jgi:hypothetical protein
LRRCTSIECGYRWGGRPASVVRGILAVL